MGYGYKLRIGLLVPSSNTTMEPAFYRMAPDGVSIHTTRMRLDEVTQKGLIEMAEDAERASALLATAGVDLVVYGCTTGSLVGGVKWEKALMNRIEKRTGIPAFSTSGAVVEALRLFGGRIGIATPYTETLNQIEREFLEAHGIEVGDMKGLGLTSNLEIGRTPMKTIQELVKRVIIGADTIFISCTNLPVIDLIEELEKEHGLPMVTSNQASMWAALRTSGLKGIKGYGQLLKKYL